MATANAETSEIRRKGRQRLIGAITIVLLLVVFVPMILDPEPRQDKKDPVLAIPPKDSAPPLPAPAAKGIEPAPAAVEPAKAEPTKAEPAKAEPAKAEPPKASQPAPAQPPQAASAPKLDGFALQVGAFADEEKLRVARAKLSAARIPHFTERLPSGLTRLRAGPYKTREEADKAVAAVKAAGLESKVVALP
jgi:DedD protein